MGLGPDHDWSSHAADAFGVMAVAYEAPSRAGAKLKPIDMRQGGRALGWADSSKLDSALTGVPQGPEQSSGIASRSSRRTGVTIFSD